MQSSWFQRSLALLIAFIAFAGIGIHVVEIWSITGSLWTAVSVLGGYFTILTNLIIAIAFTLLAMRGPEAIGARSIAGIMISIALVGIVYGLLLQGLYVLTGGAAISNVLLHMVTPVLVPIYWFLYVPRGRLQWRDPLVWALYPIAYLVYALVRGAAEGSFSYPFIDYVANGIPATVVTVAVITVAFLIVGWLIVALDKRLAR